MTVAKFTISIMTENTKRRFYIMSENKKLETVATELFVGDAKELLDAGFTTAEVADKLGAPIELVDKVKELIDECDKAGLNASYLKSNGEAIA